MKREFSLPSALQELAQLKQWVCHRNKVPIDPFTGANAKSNDPATWGDFATAYRALQAGRYDGIGFEFGAYEPETLRVAGIDLDHVLRADGTLEPFASEIVERMKSYTELSPSGTGLHILCFVKLSAIGNKKGLESGCAIEMYNHGRYFTVTGKVYGEEREIGDRTKEFAAIHEKYFKKTEPERPPVIVPQVRDFTDRELLEKMFSSQRGYEIRRLYNGDIGGYASHSEADLALVAHLLFWTGGDEGRTDGLFRESGLMREKWDRADYRERTLDYAKSNQSSVYDPAAYAWIGKDMGRLSPVGQLISEGGVSSKLQLSETTGQDISYYLMNGYSDDEARFAKYKDRKTGFSNLDSQTNLYPGLYVLGAISSLGKTTFACQLSDQLARAGEHVLYFSLEQSRYELVTKGLARLTAQRDKERALSAIEVRNGVVTEELRRAKSEYVRFATHEIIYECGFDTTIETIIGKVQSYIEDTGVKPIVIVDYLQIIRPLDSRQSTKDAVDGHVRAFKKLQVENDLVVLLISSLNRQNYLTPIDYESFKESGGIEYTADVIWGLQLSVMNNEMFDKEKGLKQKREAVRAAKKANPREIELVCLKNRYGVSSYTCRFQYYAKNDYFVPRDESSPVGQPREPLSF